MNPKDILNAMNDIDPELLEPAPKKSRKGLWISIGAVAAVLALIITPLLAMPRSPLRMTRENQELPPATDASGRLLWVDSRAHKDANALSQEYALIYPWEYLTVSEQYSSVTVNGITYRTRARTIAPEYLADVLGTCEGHGYDTYEEKEYLESFEVRAIDGISPTLLVAVKLDEYYVFMNDSYQPPATLGDFWESYGIEENLTLGVFYETRQAEQQGARQPDAGSGEKLLQMLRQHSQAPWQEWPDSAYGNTHYLSFSVSSEALGIANKSLSITETGLVLTNIAEWGYCFDIGPEAARGIMDYALQNSAPYDESLRGEKWLAGHVSEIGDGFIVVDDSVMLEDPAQGLEFRVITEDIRLRRVVEFPGMQVGDFVVVRYTDTLYAEEPLIIQNATALDPAVYADGQALIPE